MRIVRLHPEIPGDYCCNLYWVVSGSGRNTLVDAGSRHPSLLAALLREMEAHPKGIGRKAVEQVVVTHGHYDHVGGLDAIRERFRPTVLAFRKDAGVDHAVADGTWLRMGDKDFKVLHTPGHSEDSICLHCPETGDLFSGDTLYRISDAEGEYPECYARSLERLLGLDIAAIHPGHGAPITSGAREFVLEAIANVRASALRR